MSADIEAVHGYPVFVVETFVDVSRFAGTCHHASNWRTASPASVARWRHHGQPKEIFVFELTDGAAGR